MIVDTMVVPVVIPVVIQTPSRPRPSWVGMPWWSIHEHIVIDIVVRNAVSNVDVSRSIGARTTDRGTLGRSGDGPIVNSRSGDILRQRLGTSLRPDLRTLARKRTIARQCLRAFAGESDIRPFTWQRHWASQVS
jgi:hypothetical protein